MLSIFSFSLVHPSPLTLRYEDALSSDNLIAMRQEVDMSPSPEVEDIAIPSSPSSLLPQPMIPSPTPNPVFAFQGSISGFVRTIGTGVVLQIGVTATLRFSLEFTGILTRDVSRNDGEFVNALRRADRPAYEQFVNTYSGGLDVPFLVWIGADLTRTISMSDLERVSLLIFTYRRLAIAARNILRRQEEKRWRISGSVIATGNSFIPTQYFAFIQIATVTLRDGREITVVSSNPGDLTVANEEGMSVLSTIIVDEFNVEQLA